MEIHFDQLGYQTLSKSEAARLADLVFLSDPYIYPACCSEEQFILIVTQLILSGQDAMFSSKNCFVARSEEGEIVGLILWVKGGLHWDDNLFRETAQQLGIHLPVSFELAKKDYFDTYAEDNGRINVINVCVHPSYRGRQAGTQMLAKFTTAHKGESFELVTLADNTPAVKTYQAAGFVIEETYEGFSLDKKKPLCFKMICV